LRSRSVKVEQANKQPETESETKSKQQLRVQIDKQKYFEKFQSKREKSIEMKR